MRFFSSIVLADPAAVDTPLPTAFALDVSVLTVVRRYLRIEVAVDELAEIDLARTAVACHAVAVVVNVAFATLDTRHHPSSLDGTLPEVARPPLNQMPPSLYHDHHTSVVVIDCY